jgi:membrane protease YdiL (CAAX protease family)
MTDSAAPAPPPPAGPPRSTIPPAAPPVPRWYGLPTQRWGVPSAFVPWYVFVVVVLLGDGFGLVVVRARIPIDAEAANFTAGMIAYGLLALTVAVVLRRHGIHHVARAIGLAFRPVDIAIGIGGFVGIGIVRVALSAALVPLVGAPSHGNVPISSSPVWFALSGIVLAGIVAPVVEEAMTRGLLLRAVRARSLRVGMRRGRRLDERGLQVRAAWVAVLVSSVVFTAAHLHEGLDDWRLLPYLVVTTFPFAIAAGWFAIATRRLGAGIIMHVLTNTTAVVVGFVTLHR